MKIGRFTLSGVSIALLVIQLLIVSSIAAKYLWQRFALPARLDPRRGHRSRAAHARPLPLPAAHRRRLPKHAPFGQTRPSRAT